MLRPFDFSFKGDHIVGYFHPLNFNSLPEEHTLVLDKGEERCHILF